MYLLSSNFLTLASSVDRLDYSTAGLFICFSTLHIVGSFYLNFLRLLQYYKVLRQYYSVLRQYYNVLLCTTKYYNVLLQYYSVLQSTTPVLLCTTKYYSSTTKYYASTTLYYACTTTYYSGTTFETSFTMCGATRVTVQLHQILRLPRRMNVINDLRHI